MTTDTTPGRDRDDLPASPAGLRPLPLRDRLDRCEGELVRVRRRLEQSEARADRLARACTAAESRCADAAKLLVALSALHATVEREAVLAALCEIVINLLGSEDFALFEVEDGGEPALAVSFGGSEAHRAAAHEQVLRAAQDGEPRLGRAQGDPAGVAACLPLVVESRVVGVLAVYALLPQKTAFEEFDHELLAMLGTHAATALVASRPAASRPAGAVL